MFSNSSHRSILLLTFASWFVLKFHGGSRSTFVVLEMPWNSKKQVDSSVFVNVERITDVIIREKLKRASTWLETRQDLLNLQRCFPVHLDVWNAGRICMRLMEMSFSLLRMVVVARALVFATRCRDDSPRETQTSRGNIPSPNALSNSFASPPVVYEPREREDAAWIKYGKDRASLGHLLPRNVYFASKTPEAKCFKINQAFKHFSEFMRRSISILPNPIINETE